MKSETNQVVNMINNKVMTSYFKGKILASSVLSKKARDAHVFKDLHSASLIYLGGLFDDGFTSIPD